MTNLGIQQITEGDGRMEDSALVIILNQIHGEISGLKTHVESLDVSIRGNGKPGLNDRMLRIEGTCSACKESSEKFWSRFGKPLVGILLTGIVFLTGLGFLSWIGSKDVEDQRRDQTLSQVMEQVKAIRDARR
jgi:hypothetical protein